MRLPLTAIVWTLTTVTSKASSTALLISCLVALLDNLKHVSPLLAQQGALLSDYRSSQYLKRVHRKVPDLSRFRLDLIDNRRTPEGLDLANCIQCHDESPVVQHVYSVQQVGGQHVHTLHIPASPE